MFNNHNNNRNHIIFALCVKCLSFDYLSFGICECNDINVSFLGLRDTL